MWFEGVLCAEIDGAADEVFEFIGDVEEFPAEVRVGLEFDQAIDVGAGVGIAAGGRTEDGQFADAVSAADFSDRRVGKFNAGGQGHEGTPDPLSRVARKASIACLAFQGRLF